MSSAAINPAAVSSCASLDAGRDIYRWFAVYTRSRHEKFVAEQFRTKDMEYFLPLYTSARRWKDRVKTLTLPLFAGYLFVRTVPSQFLRVLEINGVASLVGGARPQPLADEEIQQFQRWLSLQLAIEPNPYLAVGRRVRVARGPLADAEGIVIRRKNGFRLVVTVELLQRSVSLEIDAVDIASC